MSQNFTSLKALQAHNLISAEDEQGLTDIAEKYSVSITQDMANLIDPNNPNDPIKAQYIPTKFEDMTTADEFEDPIGDFLKSPIKGLVHRYPDRVLIKPIHACAVYCRFCFRREQVGRDKETLTDDDLQNIYAYLRDHNEIWEIIFTGGDPLLISPRRLQKMLDEIAKIDHIKIIRFHSRLPIAAPDLLKDAHIEILKNCTKPIWLSLHINHANELTDKNKALIKKLNQAGVPLISQSVLLKGINDNVKTLDTLFRELAINNIKPYYLHHPDMAKGTGHFRLSTEEGKKIYSKLCAKLSGLAQPKYVIDAPDGSGKKVVI